MKIASALPGDHGRRHQRQGLDLRDARVDPARRRLPHRALHLAAPRALQRARARSRASRLDDALLCEAFAAVEQARGEVPLTYFEFGTLAAFWIFSREKIETAVLEVGLGGRLDAVNVLDPDCAVLTSVGIDHVDYLGADRESIGREKAGIFRAGRPAVIAEPDPPQSVLRGAGREAVPRQGFRLRSAGSQWTYWGPRRQARPGSPIRRCAERSSCATPPRRCARSTRSAAGRDAGRAPRARRGGRCRRASRCCPAGRR